jgi:hypothetical protein
MSTLASQAGYGWTTAPDWKNLFNDTRLVNEADDAHVQRQPAVASLPQDKR